MTTLYDDLCELFDKYTRNKETASFDFILAQYLTTCLVAFREAAFAPDAQQHSEVTSTEAIK